MARRPHDKTARFELRCSPKELEAWRIASTVSGMPLSKFIRKCVEHYLSNGNSYNASVRRPLLSKIATIHRADSRQANPVLIRQLAAIGNNLNQIAHWANAHKSRQEAKLVEEEVQRTRKALEKLLNGGGNYAD